MRQHLNVILVSLCILFLLMTPAEASGNALTTVKFKVQKGICLSGERTGKDRDILGISSSIECALKCSRYSSVRGSFDADIQVCSLLYSMDAYVQVVKEKCKNFIVGFIEKFQLSILWKLDLHAKGANLGSGGSALNVLNENGGVVYGEDHAVFSGHADTNLTAVGLKSFEIVDFTLSWWMIPDNYPHANGKCIFESWTPNQAQFVSFHVWQGNTRRINVYALDDTTGTDWNTHATESLPENQWTFVTYVHKTATGRGTLYFNAKEVVDYMSRHTVFNPAMKTSRKIGDRLRIGTASPGRGNTEANNFQGSLKCITFVTRVMTVNEIVELMQECK